MAYLHRTIVERAERYVAQHPLARHMAIAEACGVSVAALGRAVRVASGLRLREWRQRHLRATAECLLAEPVSWSVKEVGAQLGFSSQQAFARWFRRVCGCSPSAYRTAHDPHVNANKPSVVVGKPLADAGTIGEASAPRLRETPLHNNEGDA